MIAVGVGAVVTRRVGDKVELLLVQRAKEPGRGTWAVPGGRMMPGESLKQCAERETFEETRLRVVAQERGCYAFHIRVGPELQYVVVEVLAELEEDERAAAPVAGDDAVAAAFVGRRAFDALAVNEETRRMVRELGLLERLA